MKKSQMICQPNLLAQYYEVFGIKSGAVQEPKNPNMQKLKIAQKGFAG